MNGDKMQMPAKLPESEYYQQFKNDIMGNSSVIDQINQIHFDFIGKYALEKTDCGSQSQTFILGGGINLDTKYEGNYENKWMIDTTKPVKSTEPKK